jgi:hypothetical protein
MVEWVALLLRIREIRGSNLTQIWVILSEYFSCFPQSLWAVAGSNSK